MRKIPPLTTFAALMALATGAATAAVSVAEKKFATEAAQGGVAEVEMGQLALQKATSPEVKQFAQRMVSDHTQANQELMQLAKSEGMDLPSQVDAKHKRHGASAGDEWQRIRYGLHAEHGPGP